MMLISATAYPFSRFVGPKHQCACHIPSSGQLANVSASFASPLIVRFCTLKRHVTMLTRVTNHTGFEIMQLDPPEPTLVTLEKDAFRVVGQNWQKTLDQLFVDNLGKHRKYLVQSVRDLLRAMRNKVSFMLYSLELY